MNKKSRKAARTSDLAAGEMRQIEIDGRKVLLGRSEEGFFATAAACPHLGAPLEEGRLAEGRIVCPWHQAVYEARDGALVNPPSWYALPAFKTYVEGDDVIVELPDGELPEMEIPEMVEPDFEEDGRTFLILGSGGAGASAAEALRQDGYRGRIVLVTQENARPYDRTFLSKSYLAAGEGMGHVPLREADFYEKAGIDLETGRRVVRVDARERTLEFQNGDTLTGDKLLLCPGSVPRRLDVEGANLKNVFTLRTPSDAEAIAEAVGDGGKIVLVGASFIGMECAASLLKRNAEVTVVAPEKTPFERTLGEDIGKTIRKACEEKGVTFHLGDTIQSIRGEGRAEYVRLKSGEEIPTDAVLFGVGVDPATDFIVGVEKHEDGGLPVDGEMRVRGLDEEAEVFAAGDVVWFPNPLDGRFIRVEHWRVAQQQGRQAAHAMAGSPVREPAVPFFWTWQGPVNLRYVGHAEEWDDVKMFGDVGKGKFVAYYLKDGATRAVAASGYDMFMTGVSEGLRKGVLPVPQKPPED